MKKNDVFEGRGPGGANRSLDCFAVVATKGALIGSGLSNRSTAFLRFYRRTGKKVERFAILAAFIFTSTTALADGVVSSVVKAPITPDGDVAGEPTDLVIDLDTSLDPAFLGRPLPAGCSVAVTLPDAFQRTDLIAQPVQDVFTAGCAPGAPFDCTTGIFLQGWPQHPILPHFPIPPLGAATEYALTQGVTDENTLVFTALTDLDAPNPNPAPGPGLKQIHLINGFTNPTRPGFYPVFVEFEGEEGCPTESGVANVHIVPKTRPSAEVTSVFNIGAPNTIYQETDMGTDAPFAWDLLLWNRNGGPMEGVTVEMVNSDFALLKQGKRAIGNIRIHAPDGALGHMVAGGPSFEINAPIKGVPAGRLTVQFTAGSESGRYTTTVMMYGGNALNMFVDVP